MRSFSILLLLVLAPMQVFATNLDSGCSDPAHNQKNNKLSQAGGVFTNVISSPVTSTSMASGTSGCKTQGFVREEDREASKYLAEHTEELKSEIASGRHEYLLGFEDLVGCKGHTDTVVSSMKSSESPLMRAHSNEKFVGWLQSLRHQCQS